MDWVTGINGFAVVGTIAMGLLGLVAPRRAAMLVRLRESAPEGFAEFRATYGGLFVGLGLVPLLSAAPEAYLVAAAGWGGAAAGRLVSMWLDGAHWQHNLGGLVLEASFAVALAAGNLP